MSSKSEGKIILCFENFNGLPTTKSGCHSDKISSLRHVWSKLNADVIALVETQINTSLLPNKESIHTTMFRNNPATSILSNNTNEIIGKTAR